jgi:hypothetical protein
MVTFTRAKATVMQREIFVVVEAEGRQIGAAR